MEDAYVFEINSIGITATLVVRILYVFSDILPREESFQPGDFGCIVSNLEDKVDNRDRLGASSVGENSRLFELYVSDYKPSHDEHTDHFNDLLSHDLLNKIGRLSAWFCLLPTDKHHL